LAFWVEEVLFSTEVIVSMMSIFSNLTYQFFENSGQIYSSTLAM